jgi:hypothetical protein
MGNPNNLKQVRNKKSKGPKEENQVKAEVH